MLDLLARLARRRSAYVVAAILTTIAVVIPSLSHHSSSSQTGATTTDLFVGTDPGTLVATSTPPSTTTTSRPNGSTVSSVATGPTSSVATGTTISEVNRPGDPANPGALYPGRPDIRPNDHEAVIGADQTPVRISGFSAWVARVTAATTAPDSSTGTFIRLVVRLVNRDSGVQEATQSQWQLRRPDGVVEPTSFATPTFVTGVQIAANGETFGELWFTTNGPGRYWLAFRPSQSSARGVWAVDVS